MASKFKLENKIALASFVVAVLGLIIAYFQLFSSNNIDKNTTYGNNSPIIKSEG